MAASHILQLTAGTGSKNLVAADFCSLHRSLYQLFRHHIIFTIGRNHTVFKCRTNTDRQVARQGPSGGGPDHKIGLAQVFGAERFQLAALIIDYIEFDIDRMARILGIFNLRFCKRGIAGRTPVDRFQPLIDIPLVGHCAKYFHLTRFKRRIQSEIRIIPVSDHPKTLKLFPLYIHIVQCKLTAVFAQRNWRNITRNPCFFERFQFDRQSMGIPARDIGRFESV